MPRVEMSIDSINGGIPNPHDAERDPKDIDTDVVSYCTVCSVGEGESKGTRTTTSGKGRPVQPLNNEAEQLWVFVG